MTNFPGRREDKPTGEDLPRVPDSNRRDEIAQRRWTLVHTFLAIPTGPLIVISWPGGPSEQSIAVSGSLGGVAVTAYLAWRFMRRANPRA